jgi:shikimate kinase
LKLAGVASACGSATVVNAIATGKGAAFGIDLRVMAQVRLDPTSKKIVGRIAGARESSKLIEACVRNTLRYLNAENFGASVVTTSDIPIAVGLSSSSAAANAVVLATFTALGRKADPSVILKLGIDAAFETGVTITGALDDAAASLYGCGVVTDNLKRKIIKRFKVDPSLKVVIYVPPFKLYTAKLRHARLESIREGVAEAHRMVIRGDIWGALTLNGLLYSCVLKQDLQPTLEALSAGALAAGITGTGPATVAVAEVDSAVRIAKTWRKRPGRVILSGPARKVKRWGLDE